MKKEYCTSFFIFVVAFVIVAFSIFIGAYHSNISLGIIFIVWTLNGFMQGMVYERFQRREAERRVHDYILKLMEEESKREGEEDGQL